MEATKPSARDRLLDTAAELFYRDGIRAVGIDTIVDRSGVARMTLYRHFASKDDLIAAYLERQDGLFRAWLEGAVGDPGTPLLERVRGLFDAMGAVLVATDLRGCPFQNAAAEFPDSAHPAHAVPAANKRWMRARLRSLAEEGGVDDADALAGQLVLLIEGALASAAVLSSAEPAVEARDAALKLAAAHLR